MTSDNNLYEIITRVQRFEDFDGRADRLIIGLARYLTPAWRFAVLGDIYGDKEESDLYIETRWQPDDTRLLRIGYILPDLYFNMKTENDDYRYIDKPQTWFLHYRERFDANWSTEFAVNYSPKSRFIDDSRGLDAAGRQTRLLGAVGTDVGTWRLHAQVTAEWADRDFIFDRLTPPDDDSFRRRMYEVLMETRATKLAYAPRIGLRHLHLKEDGWFGDGLDQTGTIYRRETTAYVGGIARLTDRSHLEPTIYAGPANVEHTFTDKPEDNRDEHKWIGKVSLPFRYMLNQENGAMLTISASLYLHKAAFGGGNIQIHWPF